jgi:glycosyltransferase involved in cell wall biosynthesis
MVANGNIRVSVIVPTLNGRGYIKRLSVGLSKELNSLCPDFEIIFVDDGSKDSTADEIKGIGKLDNRIKLIRFDRNYGQHNAICAGYKASSGDIVMTLHDDMEGNIKDIGRFLQAIESGFDIVCGWRSPRYETVFRIVVSYFLNLYFSFRLGVRIHDIGCGLKAFRKEIIKNKDTPFDAINNLKNSKFCELKMVSCMATGKSRYSYLKLIKLFFKAILFHRRDARTMYSQFSIAESYNL